jgi:8-oxo-dGTP pyrophosphatase MutT (NUDIX family)
MKQIIKAGIFIVNKNNELLVCHPTNHSPTFWSIPKGMVENGEMILNAAIRETFEETNIDFSKASGLQQLKCVEYKNRKKLLYPFLAWEPAIYGVDWDSFDIRCNSFVPLEKGGFPEMDSYLWCTISEARNLLHETQIKSLDEIEGVVL